MRIELPNSGNINNDIVNNCNANFTELYSYYSDFAIRSNIVNTVTVGDDPYNTYDYDNIADAFQDDNVLNSSYDNQALILVYPGVYGVDSEIPKDFVTIRGAISGTVTFVGAGEKKWIFDLQGSCRIDNIIFDVDDISSYIIHFDTIGLTNAITVVENCKLIHRVNTINTTGGGAFENNLSIWRNCEFIGFNGSAFCHTKENSANTIDLRYYNCTFARGAAAGNIGGWGNCRIHFEGCNFGENGIGGMISRFNTNPDLTKHPASKQEWIITGGGNKNITVNTLSQANDNLTGQPGYGQHLVVESANVNEDVTDVSGTAKEVLFGEYKTKKAGTSLKGKVLSYGDVQDIQNNGQDIVQMWKRLGDCSTVNKTLSVTVNGNTEVYIFDQDYETAKTPESTIIDDMNSFFTVCQITKQNAHGYDSILLAEKVSGKADVDLKNRQIFYILNGQIKLATPTTPLAIIRGFIVEDSAAGELVSGWSGIYTFEEQGQTNNLEYGVGSDGYLDPNADIKIGYMYNHKFYPYYN